MCNSKGAQGVVAAAWFADLTTGATRNLASSLSPAFFAGIGNRIPLPGSASAIIIKSVSNLEPEVASGSTERSHPSKRPRSPTLALLLVPALLMVAVRKKRFSH